MKAALRTRAAGVFTLLCLVAGGVPSWLFTPTNVETPTEEHQQLEHFLDLVASHTRPGDRIALLVPDSMREAGTISYRAAYLLPGRDSIRVYFDQAPANLSSLRPGDWLAVFGTSPRLPPNFRDAGPVERGALYRRVNP